ncbi:hypothetical protein ALC62_14338 [Cyphomyrmex costatus]|uniref:Uncharacterized protein n=1 Tax=Cyphomyrmex costatus TaxID=456900 RepID=A0A151I8P9_9HYME|nr:hypothetical protein ALC62_14338 [Cyphomyrmex costatus]
MTAARLAWHGSGIWTTDDVDRGVPHMGGEDGKSGIRNSDCFLLFPLWHLSFFFHLRKAQVLMDVFKAKDTSTAHHIFLLVSLTINNILIYFITFGNLKTDPFTQSTFQPQATTRTILSHQCDVYRMEYHYELSDVNHLSETSSEERETAVNKTLEYIFSINNFSLSQTIDPVDKLRSTDRSNISLRKASKSINEIRSSCAKPKDRKPSRVASPRGSARGRGSSAVGGSLRKSGGRPRIISYSVRLEMERTCLPDSVAPMVKKNWTDTSAMGGHRLINDLTKAGSD